MPMKTQAEKMLEQPFEWQQDFIPMFAECKHEKIGGIIRMFWEFRDESILYDANGFYVAYRSIYNLRKYPI
jgi:hypothetical protein